MRTVSRRMADLAQSEIRAMTQACASVKGLNMAQGVCDTPVPRIVLEGAEKAIKDGRNVYTRFDGVPDGKLMIGMTADDIYVFKDGKKIRFMADRRVTYAEG